MFKLKYNVLVLFQTILTFLNAFLLIKLFGISPQTDAYFMIQIVFTALSLIQYMPLEQFMYFYNDAKTESLQSAEQFYNFSLILSFATGLLFLAAFVFFQEGIIKLFAYKLDSERLFLLKDFVSTYKWVLLFIPVNYVCSALLIAEMKIGYPYVMGMMPTLFTVFAQLFCWRYGIAEISLLVKAGLWGVIAGCFLNLLFIKNNLKYKFHFVFHHSLSWKYVRNSFSMRFGHNIHDFLFPLITNNFLSSFPSGFVSYFYYAQKIIGIIQAVVTGPSSRMLQSRIAFLWSNALVAQIKDEVKKYYKIFSILFLLSALISYFLIPFVFRIMSSSLVTDSDVGQVQGMFAFLVFWNFILFIEFPFDVVLISSKNSRIFVFVNSFFITIYSFSLILLKDKMGINAIFVSLIFCQSIALFLYSRKSFRILESDFGKAMGRIISYLRGRLYFFETGRR